MAFAQKVVSFQKPLCDRDQQRNFWASAVQTCGMDAGKLVEPPCPPAGCANWPLVLHAPPVNEA